MIREIPEKAERDERLSNIDELLSTAEQYENDSDEPFLSGFLEDVALVSDIDKYDEEADAVVLMTIHSAKGLEFPEIFLPGMEEGIFPGYQTIMNPDEIEEERRLAYVAITRAKEKVFISHVGNRMMNGRTQSNQLSRFANEIPRELTERSGEEEDRYSSFIRPSAESARRFNTRSEKSTLEVHTPSFSRHSAPSRVERFDVGESVSHSVFGKGIILSARDMGSDVLYEVMFENHGTKKLMATFAKLKKVE